MIRGLYPSGRKNNEHWGAVIMANGLNNNQDLLRSLDDLQRTFGAPIPEVDFIQPPVEAAPVNQNQNILISKNFTHIYSVFLTI